MWANAVSTALERLYATTPVASGHLAVLRVASVARVRPVDDDLSDPALRDPDARGRAEQRHALTQGVRIVFTQSTAGEPAEGALAGEGGLRGNTVPEATTPDPGLEEAILRFIHTVFRSLAEADGAPLPGSAVAIGGAAGAPAPSGASASRNALGARIGALAQRYAESAGSAVGMAGAGAAGAVPAGQGIGSMRPDPALNEAFAEVLQAMRGNAGGPELGENSRGELVNLMQRLAQAMQGAPPVDPGLPTRGGLLSTRA